MASQTRSFLKTKNRDFENILDSFLSLNSGDSDTIEGITKASGSLLVTGSISQTHGTLYEPSNVQYMTDAQTLTLTSSGVPIVVTNASTITLPGVAVGSQWWIINGNDDGTAITIAPDSSDKYLVDAAGAAGTNNKHIINTAATARKGDYVKLAYGSGDGWTIAELVGTWADQS